ncbi:MAG: hypothetical protein U1F57_02660 [bacterium]
MAIDRMDDNRPTAAEEAIRSERNRPNLKGKDGALTNQSGQQAGRAQQTKETKSAFDQVLENFTNPTNPTQSESSRFDDRVRDALKDDEKSRDKSSDRKKDKDDDKKTRSSEEKEAGPTSKEGVLKDRVLGKQNMGSGGSGAGSGGGQEQGGGSQFGGRGSRQQASLGRAEGIGGPALQGVGRPDSAYAVRAGQQVQAPREIPKVILDQLVQGVRVGLNKNLDKEIQIDISDRVFKGLSLKVSSREGKVEVAFLTGNADVRRLFESQKGKIGQALAEKGISVSQIRVQFLGS